MACGAGDVAGGTVSPVMEDALKVLRPELAATLGPRFQRPVAGK